MSNSENNKRIAKNTLMLYSRMIVIMLVSLYTSRVVLNTLGVDDFGIYNIVGGIVVVFSIVTNSMSLATQRFITFELGRKDDDRLKKVFQASLSVNTTLALLTLVLSETIGLWFINTKLNMPVERMYAANWVYQFSILVFLINIIRVPFNASIIAHEKMSFYAYLSIIEVSLKLLIVFLLVAFNSDKLILYAILIFVVSVVMVTIYITYCNKNFKYTHFKLYYEKKLFKELISFSGWNLYASVANIGKTQGVNILLNIFYGVAINAAMGVTNQVQAAINSIVSSFQVAFNPQIVKLYASKQFDDLMELIFRTSKFSYYLMLLVALPVVINMEFILQVWLIKVPYYAVEFCQLTIIYLLLESVSGPFWMTVQATGNIKWYSIVCESIVMLNVPLTYMLLKLGFEPYYSLIGMIILSVIAFSFRLYFMKLLVDFNVGDYLKKILLNIVYVTILASFLPILIRYNFNISNWEGFITNSFISVLMSVIAILVIGVNKSERTTIFNYFKKFKHNCRIN